MASAFTHAYVALALGMALAPLERRGRCIALGVLGSALPDADVWLHWAGVSYPSMFGHRGLTHSLSFAAAFALVTAGLLRPMPARAALYWFLAAASHGFLDAMTYGGGRGVAFFAPFWNERLYLPFRPVLVSPLGVTRFFSAYGWSVFCSELLWIWLPLTPLCGALWLWRRRHTGPH
ncbi:MAG: metal-dependent hydrolase [Planctomycetota bacterium]|nr:MAG: metal-dependent hydrolase [Planctomycetota bacterium]